MSTHSQAQQVVSALRREIAHLEKAEATTAEATALVGRSIQQAIPVGYARVAEGLGQIENRLRQIHQMVSGGVGNTKSATTSAGQVTQGRVKHAAGC